VWGETYDAQFGEEGRNLGASEVSTFKFGVASKADDPATAKPGATPGARPTATPSTGQTAAAIKEPTLQNFTITKYIDKGSPDLFLACCKKTLIAWGILTIRESGEEERKPYLQIEFQNLHVVSFNWELNPGDVESASQMETVEFDYQTVLIKYLRQERSGRHEAVKMKGWNRDLHNEAVGQVDTRSTHALGTLQ
jgi:type VI secretion system Hcp family effector